MNLFIATGAAIDGRTALPSLIHRLGPLLGYGRLQERADQAAPVGLDWIGWTSSGRCVGLRWIDCEDFKSDLFNILRAVARLEPPGGFASSAPGDSAPFTLVLVGHSISSGWTEIAPAIACPVRFLEVLPIRSADEENSPSDVSLCFVERRSGSHQPVSANLPEPVDFTGTTNGPSAARNSQRSNGRESEAAITADREALKVSDSLAPGSSHELRSSRNFPDLTDEEKKSFRILDRLLQRVQG